MDLTEKNLPSSVRVEGRRYQIKTDFRLILKFARSVAKNQGRADFTLLYNIYNGDVPKDEAEATEAILQFMNPPREIPRNLGEERSKEILIDYDADSELIYSAFMQEYGMDLFEVDLHYYKFKALLAGLKNSKLVDIIGYRQYTPSGHNDPHDKRMAHLYEVWRIIPEEEKKSQTENLSRFEDWLSGKRK